MTMMIPNAEMERAQSGLHTLGRDYVATVKTASDAIVLADKIGISCFDLDGVFYGRTATRWNVVN